MNKGFTLIEIMFAIALSALILPALVYVLGFSLKTARQGEKYTFAYAHAQEQMEGIISIKRNDIAWDWESSSLNTGSGEYYQPVLLSDSWQLGTKTTTPAEIGGFTKKVEIKEVKRDASGNISSDPWSISDNYSRLVSVTITWKESGETEEIKLTTLQTKN
jgi:prepilin-type N-terminal cleavage/methylation domain-containing protein